jgi:hypothetical protein
MLNTFLVLFTAIFFSGMFVLVTIHSFVERIIGKGIYLLIALLFLSSISWTIFYHLTH